MLAGVYRAPGFVHAHTVCSRVKHEGFHLHVNLQKKRVYGCVHAIRVILNTGKVCASIKFKWSCTIIGILLIGATLDELTANYEGLTH